MAQSSSLGCRSGRLAALACACVLALTGCSGDADSEPEATTPPTALSSVIQPGSPGESNRTLSPDDYPAESDFNDADTTFITMMITHHAQALEMTELAKTRADDAQVVALAERIEAGQGPEIHTMISWLQARGLPLPPAAGDHGGHDHGSGAASATPDGSTMHGMLSEEQMEELADADGAEFDELFLRGMIQHHEGAIAMAETVQTDGTDLYVAETAADVASGQGAEIARMQGVLASLA